MIDQLILGVDTPSLTDVDMAVLCNHLTNEARFIARTKFIRFAEALEYIAEQNEMEPVEHLDQATIYELPTGQMVVCHFDSGFDSLDECEDTGEVSLDWWEAEDYVSSRRMAEAWGGWAR